MKNILITGSTDGIGKLTAINLAKQGHNIYLHGRNAQKLETTIKEVSDISTGKVSGFLADLADLQQVKQLSGQINRKLNRLDVLINNAGVFNTSTPSINGFDLRYTVNYFAPVLLTTKILPLLTMAGTIDNPTRIINLSSAAQSPVSISALLGQTPIDVQSSYAQSKLALTIWSMYLAEQLTDKPINVIAVNPGSLLNTRMVAEAYGTHWSSAEKGSDILTQLATSDEFITITGKYFDNDLGKQRGDFSNAHSDAYDTAIMKKLAVETQRVLQPFL